MFRRNVLIFHQAALGDFIVTWPLAMALSRVFPQSRIIYVTHSQKGALAERVLRVESTDSEAGWHGLFISDVPKLPPQAAKLLEGAHTVVSLTAGQIDNLARGVSWIAPHAKLISLDTRLDGPGHVTDLLMHQLSDNPAIASAIRQMLRSVADRGIGFGRSSMGRILVHPGAGKVASCWPAERFFELIRKLRSAGREVRIILGEAEIEKWPQERIGRFEELAPVARPETLLGLLDEIASADAYVGNDSGPGHLAGIVGVPTLSLFGTGDAARWRPLGPRVSILQSEPISQISAEAAYTELVRLADIRG